MKIYVLTLGRRVFGPALASWYKALLTASKQRPDLVFTHTTMWGEIVPDEEVPDHRVSYKYMDILPQFLHSDYDVLICLEDDLIIPEDGFIKLINHLESGVDIAYGLYCFRRGPQRWNIMADMEKMASNSINRKVDPRVVWGKVLDAPGVGLGFTAIKREVFTEHGVAFRKCHSKASADWCFALDCQAAGLRSVGDLSIVCGHMTTEPTPRVFWPDPNAENHYRTQFLDPDAEFQKRREADGIR